MKKSKRWIAALLLAGYVILIWYNTVFSRAVHKSYRYDFHPFWSYKAIINGKEELIREHILNVAMFIPIGVLLWFCFERKRWWIPILFGCAISMSIEIMQLIGKRGFAEYDDVMHNTLGCVIGYLVFAAIGKCRSMIVINRGLFIWK